MADHFDDTRSRRITANIDLAFRFIEEVIDDPSRLNGIPAGSTVIVLPPDDPEHERANTALAERLIDAGRSVTLQRIGVRRHDRSG